MDRMFLITYCIGTAEFEAELKGASLHLPKANPVMTSSMQILDGLKYFLFKEQDYCH